MGVVVAGGVVLHGPVVPERDRAGLPAEAAGVLGTAVLQEQLADDRLGLVWVELLAGARVIERVVAQEAAVDPRPASSNLSTFKVL